MWTYKKEVTLAAPFSIVIYGHNFLPVVIVGMELNEIRVLYVSFGSPFSLSPSFA